MPRPPLLAIPALLVCGCPKVADDQGRSLWNEYTSALCRLYTEEACVDAQSDSCGASLSFDTVGDCADFFDLAMAGCDGRYEALAEGEDLVFSCVDQLDAFDCAGDEPFCDGEESIVSSGDCAALDDLLSRTCGGDTGG